MIKKGIILAGGTGSRLRPATFAVNKQLLMVYDKPLIFYPLSILMLAEIKDILIIVNKGQISNFKKLLGNGDDLGIKINYMEQKRPSGIPEAFKIGKNFIKSQNVALILGDNFFYGQGLGEILKTSSNSFRKGAMIFLKGVKNPEKFGVANINKDKITKIVEKPKKFISDKVITGLYFFDKEVSKIAASLKPSKRGETEITHLIKKYHDNNNLNYINLGLGSIWSDAGSIDDMMQISNYVASIDKIQSFKIGCLEQIALQKKWITKKKLKNDLIKKNYINNYSKYINNLTN